MKPSPLAYHRGTIAVIALAILVPLGLWLRLTVPSAWFTSPYNTLTTIAQVSGLLALSIYSINILLSARYRAVDWLFFGLDRAYRIHRLTGIAGFSFMMTHVASISLRAALLSQTEFIRLWLNTTDTATLYGRFAFLGFGAVITLTLFAHLTYERMKLTHQTLGAFLLLGGFHAYLIPSDVAVNMPLRWYMLGLTTIGVASYIVRTLLKRWLVPRRVFTVQEIHQLSPAVTEVVLTPQDNKPVVFRAGQFNFYRFLQPGFPAEDHPFSITAGTHENRLRLSAKALGDFTAQLPQLKAGAIAQVQGPFGGFSYQLGGARQIWVAGGIGITPFISMVRSLLHDTPARQLRVKIDLFWSVNNPAEAVYENELQRAAQVLPVFRLHVWPSTKQGYLTVPAVSNAVETVGADWFLCGPPAMLRTLRRQLRAAHVSTARIHFEKFQLL